MSSTFGKNICVTIFGESHGEAIGTVITGFPAGLKVDWSLVESEMDRRKPGQTAFSTPRAETDLPEVISGIYEGHTTGAPITCLINNLNKRSADYAAHRSVMRPSHADYAAQLRYKGFTDPRGGGHFSGRLTAGLVFAGSLARQILRDQGIEIIGHISQIGAIRDSEWNAARLNEVAILGRIQWGDRYFPMDSDESCLQAKEVIEEARLRGDSVGGMVEVVGLNVPGGLGNPMFDGIENRLSSAVFGIPGVKGILFGAGATFANGYGSTLNDPLRVINGDVVSISNHNGGINGGITNGMPIQFSVVFKPTPSIGSNQETVEKRVDETGELYWQEVDHSIQGRHDPCIVPRALPVVEAVLALVLLDFIMEGKG